MKKAKQESVNLKLDIVEIETTSTNYTAFEAGDSVVIETATNLVAIHNAKIQKTFDSKGNFVSATIVRRSAVELKGLDQYVIMDRIDLPND